MKLRDHIAFVLQEVDAAFNKTGPYNAEVQFTGDVSVEKTLSGEVVDSKYESRGVTVRVVIGRDEIGKKT